MWSPECKGDQFSASLIRLASGDTNAIYVGWAGGDGSTGCYDLLCPGFVQTNKGIVLGAVFNRTSDYGGIEQQFYVKIAHDPVTKNWILSFGDQERQAGYRPKELFPLMEGDTGATRLSFGGIMMPGPEQHTLPPTGSGNKPGSDVRYTTFMNRIFFSEEYTEFRPPPQLRTKRISDNC
ncbi:hypothetical protein MLD38_037369 [Melastoma candidum]|uniref:Uncharacterized protein n=1 Tax=Melastoma candidum TaxID=119954 RepID=A0ACB9LMN1_9MYRT|nr:hypothetical protein MLD38_037369 [Melastoma candidum]